MDDDVLVALDGFGVAVGFRQVSRTLAPHGPPGAGGTGGPILRCAAGQAAAVIHRLGMARLVGPATFGDVTGFIAGGMTAVAAELGGRAVPLSDASVPDAGEILAAAYRAMQRRG